MTPAILVIDMQNDFVAENGAIPVLGIPAGLERFAEFISTCRGSGVPVIYTRHCYDPVANPVEAKLFPGLAGGCLRKGSPGWQICNELCPEKQDLIIDKPRYDAFFATPLLSELQARSVDTVIITGTMTEVCCDSTARSAMYNDFTVWFCEDLTFCSDPVRHQATLGVIASHFGEVLSAEKIVARLNQRE